ncbi:MAG TPA: DAK2 domain-containing protein [Tissierellaceae bacterium]|nr:DAK2 domain-containing protein [Tissierellaceae bacterium]
MEIIDGVMFKNALKGAAKLLENNMEEVNSLNVFPVPDGDTGTNMSLTMNSAVKKGLSAEDGDTYEIALSTSQGSLMGARGNSGVILSQLFRGLSNGLKGSRTIDVPTFANGLQQAAETAYNAVMKPTEGTILTVARECGEFAISISKTEKDIVSFLERVIKHGNDTLNKTPDMLPVLKQANVVDAGGKGYMYVLEGMYNSLAGIENYESFEEETVEEKYIDRQSIDTDKIEYGYCTEFIINAENADIDKLREELSIDADSLLVVGGDDIIKIHIHTNNPGLILEKGLKLGELSDIKIDNMRYQHEEVLLKDELLAMEDKKKEETKKFSFVSVSIGEGLDQVFKELNVDYVLSGGQTMNPSTEDILKAIDNTKGENIFILPNNKNIILTAEQTKELSDKNIIIIPTRSIPEGIGALLGFDESLSVEENEKNMTEYIEDVYTGEVTYAVRDTSYNDTKIDKDDIIGISDDEIVTSGKDINKVAKDLINSMMNDDISIISIFYGNNIEDKEVEKLADLLEEKYEDVDVEVVFGGQPLYYYIFSLE